MHNLPSDREHNLEEALKTFEETGSLSIFEPCDCGSRVQHNNGGNYHDEIYLRKDSGKIFVKFETTCELVPRAEWQETDNAKSIIAQNSDWL